MDRRYKLIATMTLLLLALSCWYTEGLYATAQASQADEKLSAASRAVEQAFNAVSEAEQTGANVTTLITQLNAAAKLLAEAENSYRNGDFNAVDQVDNAIPIAQQVTASAIEAKQAALANSQNAFWFTIAFTVIGIAVFVLALFLSWRWFKRRYVNNLYTAKPEVTKQ